MQAGNFGHFRHFSGIASRRAGSIVVGLRHAHRTRMFKILHRYVFISVAGSAAIAMLFIGFIFGAVNLLRDVFGYMLDGTMPFGIFLQLCWFMAEFVAMYAVPAGLLLGVLLVFGRLSADNEITAMRTAGRSIAQIARPVFVLAILGVIGGFYINFYAMPRSRIQYHVVLDAAVRESAHNLLVPKTFNRLIRDARGAVVYFDSREGAVYHNLWVWILDKQQRAEHIIHAESATGEFDAATGSIILTPRNSTWERRNPADLEEPVQHGAIPTIGSAEKVPIPITSALGQRDMSKKIQWLTLPQLLARKRQLAGENAGPVAQLKVAFIIHEKFASSLAALAFVFVAIPLGVRTQRKESSANFALAALLVVAYYIASTAISWLDKRPELHPEILIWLPNVVFIAAGLWLLRRVEQTR